MELISEKTAEFCFKVIKTDAMKISFCGGQWRYSGTHIHVLTYSELVQTKMFKNNVIFCPGFNILFFFYNTFVSYVMMKSKFLFSDHPMTVMSCEKIH